MREVSTQQGTERTFSETHQTIFALLKRHGFSDSPKHHESRDQLKVSFEKIIASLPSDIPIQFGNADIRANKQCEEWALTQDEILRFFAERLPYSALTELNTPASSQEKLFPLEAAIITVLLDLPRTKAFVRGVESAIEDIGNLKGDAPITVLEAGCGGFPILSIAAALKNPHVQLMCYEINPYAARMATLFIKALGLESQIVIREGDATHAHFESGTRFDLVVSETFDAALQAEPIHHIFKHLLQYTDNNTILIPHSIQLSPIALTGEPRVYGYYPPADESLPRVPHELEASSRRNAVVFRPGLSPDVLSFTVPLPKLDPSTFAIGLRTSVNIYKNHRLLPEHSYATRLTGYAPTSHGSAGGHQIINRGDVAELRIVPGTSRDDVV